MGASVLHEDAVFPVRKAGIPINIRNTNAQDDAGTRIVESTSHQSKYTITGIAGKKGFVSVNIDKDKTILVYCRSGKRATTAVEKLKSLGYTAYNMGGLDNIDLPKK